MKTQHESAKRKAFLDGDTGDMMFSYCNSFSSRFIRWVLGFRYSHVSIKVNDRTIIDADVGGIHVRPIESYMIDKTAVIEMVRLPKQVNRSKFIEALNTKTGSYYDYGLILGSMIARLFKIPRTHDVLVHGASRYTCSEFVAESLLAAGLEFKFPPSQITPEDLYYSMTLATKEPENDTI